MWQNIKLLTGFVGDYMLGNTSHLILRFILKEIILCP